MSNETARVFLRGRREGIRIPGAEGRTLCYYLRVPGDIRCFRLTGADGRTMLVPKSSISYVDLPSLPEELTQRRSIPIADLEVTIRVHNALAKLRIRTLGELIDLPRPRLDELLTAMATHSTDDWTERQETKDHIRTELDQLEPQLPSSFARVDVVA